jgi:hypothetical protein
LTAFSDVLAGASYRLNQSDLCKSFSFHAASYEAKDVMIMLYKLGLLTLCNINNSEGTVELMIPNMKASNCMMDNMSKWLKEYTAKNYTLPRHA